MRHKSLYKTLTYRITSVIITVVVLRVFVDEWYVIGKITLISQALKAVWYYAHEKIYKAIKRRIINGKNNLHD